MLLDGMHLVTPTSDRYINRRLPPRRWAISITFIIISKDASDTPLRLWFLCQRRGEGKKAFEHPNYHSRYDRLLLLLLFCCCFVLYAFWGNTHSQALGALRGLAAGRKAELARLFIPSVSAKPSPVSAPHRTGSNY